MDLPNIPADFYLLFMFFYAVAAYIVSIPFLFIFLYFTKRQFRPKHLLSLILWVLILWVVYPLVMTFLYQIPTLASLATIDFIFKLTKS